MRCKKIIGNTEQKGEEVGEGGRAGREVETGQKGEGLVER